MHSMVNGVEQEIRSDALTPLLRVLREELHITSPKAGCEQGGCGACTVLVDGEPRRACLTPLAAIEGAEVTTLEGSRTASTSRRSSAPSTTSMRRSAASARRA